MDLDVDHYSTEELIELLLSNGANPFIMNERGETAMSILINLGEKGLINKEPIIFKEFNSGYDLICEPNINNLLIKNNKNDLCDIEYIKKYIPKVRINKFKGNYVFLSDNMKDMNAKQCALIAVNEILKLDIYKSDYWYWEQVKQEIQKL